MNRLFQLRETLPSNCEILQSHQDVELVLLNYNSTDGLHEWMQEQGGSVVSALNSFVYAHETTSAHFHASKAKNLAHRIATGNVLVNLDADNFIGEWLSPLREACAAGTIVVHGWNNTIGDGTYGRIAITRSLFYALGGYDESFYPLGFQDSDLLLRAQASGHPWVSLPTGAPGALPNDKAETVRYCGCELSYETMNLANARRSQENLRRGQITANPLGWGGGTVELMTLAE